LGAFVWRELFWWFRKFAGEKKKRIKVFTFLLVLRGKMSIVFCCLSNEMMQVLLDDFLYLVFDSIQKEKLLISIYSVLIEKISFSVLLWFPVTKK
jgi:hypothetical protein